MPSCRWFPRSSFPRSPGSMPCRPTGDPPFRSQRGAAAGGRLDGSAPDGGPRKSHPILLPMLPEGGSGRGVRAGRNASGTAVRVPRSPRGGSLDRFARCGAVCVSKPPTPPTGGSEDPSIVGAVGSPARRHLANETPLDRRWCRSGNDRPEGLSLQSRPGFRASNEPVREPVRGRHSIRAPSERLRLERDPAARGCVERRTSARGRSVHRKVSPRRVGPHSQLRRTPKGSKQQEHSWSEDRENRTGLPNDGWVAIRHSARHLLVLPKEAVRLRRTRSSEDGRTSAPRGRYG
jgi:hypothetical protein